MQKARPSCFQATPPPPRPRTRWQAPAPRCAAPFSLLTPLSPPSNPLGAQSSGREPRQPLLVTVGGRPRLWSRSDMKASDSPVADSVRYGGPTRAICDRVLDEGRPSQNSAGTPRGQGPKLRAPSGATRSLASCAATLSAYATRTRPAGIAQSMRHPDVFPGEQEIVSRPRPASDDGFSTQTQPPWRPPTHTTPATGRCISACGSV
jgi:hypothetical protein